MILDYIRYITVAERPAQAFVINDLDEDAIIFEHLSYFSFHDFLFPFNIHAVEEVYPLPDFQHLCHINPHRNLSIPLNKCRLRT